MKIKGIKGLTVAQIQEEISNGGKFVQYTYCFSLMVVSCRHVSNVYFIRSTDNAFLKSLPFTLFTLLFGWWGIPWGPFNSIGCIYTNMGGGRNLTENIMKSLHRQTKGFVFEFEKANEFAF